MLKSIMIDLVKYFADGEDAVDYLDVGGVRARKEAVDKGHKIRGKKYRDWYDGDHEWSLFWVFGKLERGRTESLTKVFCIHH